jgi:hypothetical protein
MIKTCISFLFLIALAHHSFSQGTDKEFQKLKRQVQKELELLAKYNYTDYPNLDPEAYSEQTALKLVKLLSYKQSRTLNTKDFTNLRLSSQLNNGFKIRIFSFSFHMSGMEGDVPYSVIQWCDKNGNCRAYNISNNFNCSFNDIYKLKSKSGPLYLLLGGGPSGISFNYNIAYVIKIDSTKLSTSYKAFVNRSNIRLPYTDMKFNPKTQVLKLVYGIEDDKFYYLRHESSKDKAATQKLINMLSQKEDEAICLKFDGKNFVRTSNCK